MTFVEIPDAEVPKVLDAIKARQCITCYQPTGRAEGYYCSRCDPPAEYEQVMQRQANASRTTIRVTEFIYRDTFSGCTDRNPELCACNDDGDWCTACRCLIEDGERVIAKRYVWEEPGLDGADHWTEHRHVRCPGGSNG